MSGMYLRLAALTRGRHDSTHVIDVAPRLTPAGAENRACWSEPVSPWPLPEFFAVLNGGFGQFELSWS